MKLKDSIQRLSEELGVIKEKQRQRQELEEGWKQKAAAAALAAFAALAPFAALTVNVCALELLPLGVHFIDCASDISLYYLPPKETRTGFLFVTF
jgi:hypothetical protein